MTPVAQVPITLSPSHPQVVNNSPFSTIGLPAVPWADIVTEDYEVSDLLDAKPGTWKAQILEGMIKAQEDCLIPEEAVRKNFRAKGIPFAHTLGQLREVLMPPGAQVLVQRDRSSGRIYGEDISHLDANKFAEEDRKLVETARAAKDKDGNSIIKSGTHVGITHVMCIRPSVESYRREARISAEVPNMDGDQAATCRIGGNYNRHDLAIDFHRHRVAEGRKHGVDLYIATCRLHPAANAAMQTIHEPLGWKQAIGPDGPITIKSEITLKDGTKVPMLSGLIILDTRTALQDQLIARPNYVPFRDLDKLRNS